MLQDLTQFSMQCNILYGISAKDCFGAAHINGSQISKINAQLCFHSFWKVILPSCNIDSRIS